MLTYCQIENRLVKINDYVKCGIIYKIGFFYNILIEILKKK